MSKKEIKTNLKAILKRIKKLEVKTPKLIAEILEIEEYLELIIQETERR